jgi:hypothetical protein
MARPIRVCRRLARIRAGVSVDEAYSRKLGSNRGRKLIVNGREYRCVAEAAKAITDALHQSIPRIRGAGIDRETGREITYRTSPHERISQEELDGAIQKIPPDYSISVQVAPGGVTLLAWR